MSRKEYAELCLSERTRFRSEKIRYDIKKPRKSLDKQNHVQFDYNYQNKSIEQEFEISSSKNQNDRSLNNKSFKI